MARRPVPIHPTLVFVVLLLLVAPAAVFQGNNILTWILAVMLVGTVLTLIWSRLSVRVIDIHRLETGPARVGEPFVVRYAVTNRARRLAAFSLWIKEVDDFGSWRSLLSPARAWIMEVGPGETVHAEAIFWPKRRGEARFDTLRLRTTFPFGMVRATRTLHQPRRVLVQPRMYQLRPSVLRTIVADGPLGQRSIRRGGEGDEYFGVRDLRSGDGLRDIAWKVSARRDELVCVERSHPSPPRIRVILDLTTPTPDLQCDDDARDLEERTISLCASLLAEASRQDQEFALTVLGLPGPWDASLRRGPRHLERLLGALASLNLDAPRQPSLEMHLPVAERAGLVVLRPDRDRPAASMPAAWHLTGEQLDEFLLGGSDRSTAA